MILKLTRNTKLIMLAIIIISYIFLYRNMEEIKETWVNYQQLNYGNIQTASEPLTFYRRDVYRKPYRYPVCHNVDYPINHCQTFSM